MAGGRVRVPRLVRRRSAARWLASARVANPKVNVKPGHSQHVDQRVDAENMKIRSALMQELSAHITNAGMTQSVAAQQFGVTQPRISDLMRGKIDLFRRPSTVVTWPGSWFTAHTSAPRRFEWELARHGLRNEVPKGPLVARLPGCRAERGCRELPWIHERNIQPKRV
jgi:predicted XRE-type DNA-binding protein